MTGVFAAYGLTPQEQRVVLLAIEGKRDAEIAAEMGISRETVRVYWKRVRERLGLSSRGEIIARLIRESAQSRIDRHASENERLLGEIARRRDAEELLRATLDGAQGLAILFMDADRRITEWNRGAERLLGWVREEAVGQSGDVIFTDTDRALGAPEHEARTAAEHGTAPDVRWHVKKDGTTFWGVGTMNAVYLPDGSLRGFVKVLADDTLRKLWGDASARPESVR